MSLSSMADSWVYWWSLNFSARASTGTTSSCLADRVCCLSLSNFIDVCIVYKKCLERQRLRQQKVADIVASDCQMVHVDGLATFDSQLYCF